MAFGYYNFAQQYPCFNCPMMRVPEIEEDQEDLEEDSEIAYDPSQYRIHPWLLLPFLFAPFFFGGGYGPPAYYGPPPYYYNYHYYHYR